jgi:3-hydroxy-9,10-secoandrosta-1,3,5(10)-triene-9,17-dione monooxygenase reductase component
MTSVSIDAPADREYRATPVAGVDRATFRQVLGRFPTGAAVITSLDEGRAVGLAVGSFCSVSLEPPLVLFCVSKDSNSFPSIERTRLFCVNILAESQEDLCRRFATKVTEKFGGVPWRATASGVPALDDVLGWISCTVVSINEAGDHFVVLGQVTELSAGDGRAPLVFFGGQYKRIA